MNELIGKLIAGRFRIESVIGSGGIGTVYRAIQEPLDRPVAIKMLRPEFSESPELRRRFVREARAVAALSHPNIAMVHDFGVGRDRSLFMAMEFVEGLSLAEVLDAPGLDFVRIGHLFDQILTGLAHAHARGIIHRDIKPANILVASQEDGSPLVKIVDFGIAAVAGFNWSDEDHSTGVGQVVGTPQYMAPEQARGERHVTATVDVYAVGLMLYRAMTGAEAFDGDNPMDVLMAQVSQPPPAIVFREGLDAPFEVRRLILDALAKSPRDRIPSATVFRSRVRRLLGHTTSPSLPRPSFSAVAVRERAEMTMVEEAPTADFIDRPAHHTAVEDAVPGSSSAPWAPPVGSALRGETPFVGREEEVERLVESVYGAIGADTGLVVLIDGEAGMGKSRVCAALREHLTEHAGFASGMGSFHQEGERGLRGLREAMDELLGTRGVESGSVSRQLATRLAEIGLPDEADARLLKAFLRPNLDGTGTQLVAGRPDALYELVYQVLGALGSQTPVVLVLEDIQWAGREADAFLQFVATELDQRPARFAVIATAQTGEVETDAAEQLVRRLARFDGATVLRHSLRPLDEAQARRMLASLIQADEELAAPLVSRAGGNPMHLVQLVRYLVDEQLLEPGPEGWRARPGVDVMHLLPPSLADIMALRIQQLEQIVPGSRLRDLLNRCAVLGRSFRFSVLERMLQIENRSDLLETIDADVDALLDEEYLQMQTTRDDDVLAFPSSLIRDALLERMANRRTTRRLHAYAAEAKLAIMGDELDKLAGELVRHFAEARDRMRELQYARMAADVAERSHRPNDAANHLRRAVSILDDPGRDEEDAALRTALRLRLGELLVGLGEYSEADESFARVEVEHRASAAQRVAASYGRARIATITGEFADAKRRYESALRSARSLADRGLEARGTLGLAQVLFLTGELDEARRLAELAMSGSDPETDPVVVADAVWLAGDVARSRGEHAAAVASFNRAMALFERADNRAGIARCLARLAVVHRAAGDLDSAVEHYERAQEIHRALGDRRGVAQQLNGLGDVARFGGQFARAADLYRRAVDIFQSLQLPYDAAVALTNLGLVAMESGRNSEAAAAFERAAEVSERVGYTYLSIGIGLNLAYVLGRMGLDDEAREALERSLALADASDMVDPDYARPLERLADVMATSGARDQARALLGRAREMWRELGRSDDLERIEKRLGALTN